MYVILTSRPAQFRTEPGPGLRPVERYDYLFCGTRKARFVIAELLHDTKVTIVDETPPACVNVVPSKILERFDTVERARGALDSLTAFGRMDTKLLRQELDGSAP